MNLNEKFITKTQDSRLHHCDIPIIGITGGIASGKSSVANYFARKNIPVIDADQLIKNIYKKKESFDFIQQNFPEVITNHSIDFALLRKNVFNDHDKKKKLESYLYPRLQDEFHAERIKYPKALCLIYDVPLLFERNLQEFFDVIIVVFVDAKTQLERVIKRDHISEDLAQKMINSQMPLKEKLSMAHFVIDNSKEHTGLENNNDLTLLFSKLFS
jgi:dephospho-CoA kinase